MTSIAQQMRGLVTAFELALPDVEEGRYDTADFERLATYCDNLGCSLRSEGSVPGLVVEGTVVE